LLIPKSTTVTADEFSPTAVMFLTAREPDKGSAGVVGCADNVGYNALTGAGNAGIWVYGPESLRPKESTQRLWVSGNIIS
jgi:hypothetical protein